ncbi:MAG: hypothetical protein ACI9EB_002016 [Pseudomonas sp.]|jgi:hypothetical protein
MAAVSASAFSLRRSSRSSSAMHFLLARACSRLLKSDATPSPETKQSDLERDTHYAIDKLCSKDKVGVAGDQLAAIGGAEGERCCCRCCRRYNIAGFWGSGVLGRGEAL